MILMKEAGSPGKGRNQINRGKSRDRVSKNTGRGQGLEIEKHRTTKIKTKETNQKGEGLGN